MQKDSPLTLDRNRNSCPSDPSSSPFEAEHSQLPHVTRVLPRARKAGGPQGGPSHLNPAGRQRPAPPTSPRAGWAQGPSNVRRISRTKHLGNLVGVNRVLQQPEDEERSAALPKY